MASCFGTNNGQIFNRFVFNDDGTVTGEFNSNVSQVSSNLVNLPSDCCSALGHTYNFNSGKCFYKNPCDDNNGVKVLFGLDQNDAAYFSVSDQEVSTLEVKMDYLFNYDCNQLLTCVGEKETNIENNIGELNREIVEYQTTISGYETFLQSLLDAPIQSGSDIQETEDAILLLENAITSLSGSVTTLESELLTVKNKGIITMLSDFNATLIIDKVIPAAANANPPITYETVATFPLLSVVDFEQYLIDAFENETSTGLSVDGDNCTNFTNALKLELDDNCDILGDETLNSKWLSINAKIIDESVLELIKNEKIHISVQIADVKCNISILLDKIEVNKITTITESNEVFVSKCPGFNLTKVLDNKKSWNKTSSFENREFDLTTRETDYDLSDSRLVINTKEMDLNVDPSGAIECNVYEYVKANIECILTGSTTDYTELFTTELSGITNKDNFVDVMVSELIDVKTRKTLSAYPTLIKFFEIYQGLVVTDCPESNRLGYDDLDSFIGLLGSYWIDLVEQFVPSTTLWGATNVYRSTVFHQDKLKYTPNTIDWGCDTPTGVSTIIASDTMSQPAPFNGPYTMYDFNPAIQPLPLVIAFNNGGNSLDDGNGNMINFANSGFIQLWENIDLINEYGIWLDSLPNDTAGEIEFDVVSPTTGNFNLSIAANGIYQLTINGVSYLLGNDQYFNSLLSVVIPIPLNQGVNTIRLGITNKTVGSVIAGRGISFVIYDTDINTLIAAPDYPTLETYELFNANTLIGRTTGGVTSHIAVSADAEVQVFTLDTSSVCGIVDTNPETYDNLCLKKVDLGAEYLGSFTIEDI